MSITRDPLERAFREFRTDDPDYSTIAERAVTGGRRTIRHRRVGGGVGAVAVVAVIVVGGSVLAAGDPRAQETPVGIEPTTPATISPTSGAPAPTTGPTMGPTSSSTPTDTSGTTPPPIKTMARPPGAVAWLEAPGWGAPVGQLVAQDDKVRFVQLDDPSVSVSLNWRPATDWSPDKWADCADYGQKVGTATLADDSADLCRDMGEHVLIAPPRHERFLTLSTVGLSATEATELGSQVIR